MHELSLMEALRDQALAAARAEGAVRIAAISLPVLAGWLFDLTRGYDAAIAITIGVNLLGIVIARGLPVPGSPPTDRHR
jgi:hypothetical protein